jgi:hypothetical protein
MLDVEALSEMMADVIAGEVTKALEPLQARIAELEGRPAPEKGEKGDKGDKGDPAEAEAEWASDLTLDEKAALGSSLLRKELGDCDLIQLPPLQPVQIRASTQQPASLEVHNHLPKRGIEKTVVTKHDERGRILEYERREV